MFHRWVSPLAGEVLTYPGAAAAEWGFGWLFLLTEAAEQLGCDATRRLTRCLSPHNSHYVSTLAFPANTPLNISLGLYAFAENHRSEDFSLRSGVSCSTLSADLRGMGHCQVKKKKKNRTFAAFLCSNF